MRVSILLCIFLLVLSGVHAQEEHGHDDEEHDEHDHEEFFEGLEVVVGIVAIVGIFVLDRGVKQFGGAIGKVFTMIKAGLLFIALAFFVAAYDHWQTDNLLPYHFVFEVLTLIGIVLVAIAPIIYFKPLDGDSGKSKSSSKK